MNIQSFVGYSRGSWVVQRTTYDFRARKVWNLKSNVTVKQFWNPKIASKSYVQNNVNNCTGLSLTWGQSASSYSIVIYPNDNKLEVYTGKTMELNTAYVHKSYYFNSYLFNIRFSNTNFCIFEKLWFVNNNLALGISIVKYDDYYISISFESKIRT